MPEDARDDYQRVVDQLMSATQLRHPAVGDLARQVRYRCFDAPLLAAERLRAQQRVRAELDQLSPDPQARAAQIDAIVAAGEPILGVFTDRHDPVMLEVMTRRYYRIRPLENVRITERSGRPLLTAEYRHDGRDYLVIATVAGGQENAAATDLPELIGTLPAGRTVLLDLYVTSQTPEEDGNGDPDARAERIQGKLGPMPPSLDRVAVAVRRGDGSERDDPAWYTFRRRPDGAAEEDRTQRGLHPMVAERLGLWRFSRFELNRLPAAPDVHLFRIQGREVPDDQRLMVLADVRELTILRDEHGRVRGLPQLERTLDDCLDSLRAARSADRELARLDWNRVKLYVWPVVGAGLGELDQVIRSLAPRTEGLGLEQVMVQFKTAAPDGEIRDQMLRMSRPPGTGLTLRITNPPPEPLRELNSYTQKVIRARRRGTVYPYELIPLITRSPDRGGAAGRVHRIRPRRIGSPVPVDREPGLNTANLVLGVVSTPTTRYPEEMRRVVLMGDPTQALGALAEPECRRVLAALDLARRWHAPVEWFAISAGAKIAMDSGTETMDWISRALRGIVEFTQEGGEINVVVTGINVGAQPYWNAEATMLMHTKGILIMTPDSAMVLTGKQSLDYSGGVSAEDNFGIGGYDRIMGPNGEAQYWAPDLSAAVDVLLAHYEHTYVASGERFPGRHPPATPATGTSRPRRIRRGHRVRRARGGLRRLDQSRTQEALRHALAAARGGRCRSPDAGALGRYGRRRVGRGARRAPGRAAGRGDRLRIAAAAPARARPGRRPVAVDRRHAVPPVVEEDGPGDQRRQREPPAGHPGQPVRVRRLTGVAAPAPAGIRRGDRPRDRQLRRPDRVLRGLPVSRRGVRRVLRDAQRHHGGVRRAGLPRLGDRRGARRRGGVRRARSTSARRPIPA